MTISEILPEFQNISNQPRLPVSILRSNISFDQHFLVLLDPDGIIGPDGKAIKTTSNASFAPPHNQSQLQVVFDTGFTFPQLPEYVVNAIYSGAKGAQLNQVSSGVTLWTVDCEAEINVTFKIGGQLYPVHPLDVVRELTDSTGDSGCYGTFQSVTPGAEDPTRDGILGMTFLSNVYALLDFGDFTDDSASNTSSPYVQLLSTTDPAEAHADFVATRLNGTDTTGSQHYGTGGESFFHRHRIPLIIAAVVPGVAALAGAVWLVARRRKRAYHPLPNPPVGDMSMEHVTRHGSGEPYSDPWISPR